MSERFTIEVGAADLAEQYLDRICDLHDEVFSVPPFDWAESASAEHRELLTELLRNPTFALSIAKKEKAFIGFAYGHQLPIDHGWWNDFLFEISDDIKAEWSGRTFALITLAVQRESRGYGLGRLLVDRLLASRTEERAILSVQPKATDTQAFYAHTGWRLMGRKGPLENITPHYWDIYLRSTQA